MFMKSTNVLKLMNVRVLWLCLIRVGIKLKSGIPAMIHFIWIPIKYETQKSEPPMKVETVSMVATNQVPSLTGLTYQRYK